MLDTSMLDKNDLKAIASARWLRRRRTKLLFLWVLVPLFLSVAVMVLGEWIEEGRRNWATYTVLGLAVADGISVAAFAVLMQRSETSFIKKLVAEWVQ